MDIKCEMKKRLSNEKIFEKKEQALDYAVSLQRTDDLDVAIFKNDAGKFCTVHMVNAEIAAQLGYTLIYGFYEIMYAAKSDKKPLDAIGELHNIVGRRKG